jgi:DNA-binding transcriptional ArsR family regulator
MPELKSIQISMTGHDRVSIEFTLPSNGEAKAFFEALAAEIRAGRVCLEWRADGFKVFEGRTG